MMFWDFLEALRARWRLVAAITLGVVAAVALWCLMSTRSYSASATLLFDSAQADPLASTGRNELSTLGTQADIIRSVLVAKQAVADLGLASNQSVIARYRAANRPNIPIDEWLARRLTSPTALTVLPTKSTNVLAVTYTGTDPDFAALIANAFANAFVKIQLELKIAPAKVYSQWFEMRTSDVRQRLEEAQAKLTQFQRSHGLTGADKIDIESARMNELSTQLAGAEAEAAGARAKAASNVAQSSDAQMSGLVQGLDSQIAGKSAQLQQLRGIYGPNHPAIIAAQVELAELRSKRGQAVGTAVTAIRVSSAAAMGREGGLRAALEAQRSKVLRLSGVQDQMAVLQRDVDSARAAYDAVTQRLNAIRLQSEIPQTNVSVLDTAVAPSLPSSPNIALRMMLGTLVGLLAGVGLALALEWMNPRLRTIAGLESDTHVPVLADLNRKRPFPLLLTKGAGA